MVAMSIYILELTLLGFISNLTVVEMYDKYTRAATSVRKPVVKATEEPIIYLNTRKQKSVSIVGNIALINYSPT